MSPRAMVLPLNTYSFGAGTSTIRAKGNAAFCDKGSGFSTCLQSLPPEETISTEALSP